MLRVRQYLTVFAAVVLLAAGSVLSASIMAPERSDAADMQLTMLGMSVDDLCGGETGHDHRCPFCHLVSDTPLPEAAYVASALSPTEAWQRAGDLHRQAQARDHARSPRAPPSLI